MKPGPKKTPVALALVNGNPGKRALPKSPPTPDVARPDPPQYLTDTAKGWWVRTCPQLAELGLMTNLDVDLLAIAADRYATVVECARIIAEMRRRNPTTGGLLVKTTNGNIIQNPIVGTMRCAQLDLLRCLAELGMTPAARAGMDIDVGPNAGQPANQDPADKYFA